MRLLDIWRSNRRKTGAEQAKERLQIMLAHERAGRSGPDYLPLLQKDLLAVISKYVEIDESKVAVKLERCVDYSTLEVNIELPARLADKLQTRVGELAQGTG